jgi:lipopolysaccharide transport system ATP-binding protein
VNGRVAPLLEPVLGLQPELTGQENIYLIGLTLGMRRSEIRHKLNSIIGFAGIKDFLRMQLKHYSMGMVMRLGFSVAIHIDADIILVDEAWGVGDAEFQAKSFTRLRQLRQQKDVTIIMVSHELEVIRQQTEEALWLHQGRIADLGPTSRVIDNYLQAVRSGVISTE